MPRTTRPHLSETTIYTDEQEAWMRACAAYQKRRKIKFMTRCDYLAVAKEMGYVRLTAEAAGSPPRA